MKVGFILLFRFWLLRDCVVIADFFLYSLNFRMLTANYTIRVRVGGKFVTKPEKERKLMVYEGGCVYVKNVSEDAIDIGIIKDIVANAFFAAGMEVPRVIRLWFKDKGKTVNNGWTYLTNDESVSCMLNTADSRGRVECYVTDETVPLNESHVGSCSRSNYYRQKLRNQQSQSSLDLGPDIIITQASQTKSPKVKSVAIRNKGKSVASESPKGRVQPPRGRVESPKGKVQSPKQASKRRVQSPKVRVQPPRGGVESPKGKVQSPKGRVESHKGREQSSKRKKSGREFKGRKKVFSNSDSENESSGFSDLDINWNPCEEEAEFSDDEFFQNIGKETKKQLLSEVAESLKEKQVEQDINASGEPCLEEESDGDEDDLRSLEGSDEEVDNSPYFNPEVDFKKPIKLQLGLKFRSAELLRKAVRWHAIEQRFDYYFLHNSSKRITIYCRDRCDCPWDAKRTRKIGCFCREEDLNCQFKLYAVKLPLQETWQIRTLSGEHKCVRGIMTSKVNSEYLAEKYLEEFRGDSQWKLKNFMKRVEQDLGIVITYSKAWLARSRARVILYGNAADQYARVWDYAIAIKEHNPGSTAVVKVNRIERPPPLFERMYVCLHGCKQGFKRGCRPIIGVDGCHLKGTYPGMCLAAVGKDGNNGIFPFAWATVEVENTETWAWFLQLVIRDIEGGEDGEGWTFMSDRQKVNYFTCTLFVYAS